MSSFIINPNKRNGYPTIDDNTYDFGPTQVGVYPKLFYYKDSNVLSGYPTMINWKNPSPAQSAPYPKDMLFCDPDYMNGYPSFRTLHNFTPVQSIPYPRNMMSCDPDVIEGYPKFQAGYPFESWGAFKYCDKLKKAKISPTVKYICDWAFWGSKLTKVTIAHDCTYFPHSFPEDCVVEFYEV